MTRFLLSLALGISAWSTTRAQTDTLWIVPGGVGLGGDTLAALRFCGSPAFQTQNETLGAWPGQCVVVNTDSVDHQLHSSVPGFEPLALEAGAEAVLELDLPNHSTHRIWSATQRGDLLGLETLVRTGWQDAPHFEWNLNEWDPASTWNLAEGLEVDLTESYVPRQFTINDLNFPNTLEDSTAHVYASVGEVVYISIVNHGRMDQVLHFHGFHVDILQASQHENRVGWSKDTVPVKQGECVVVKLNPNQPGEYPVHAHNLVAVTNAGFYPGGMITFLSVAP
ncbi:MAG: multicopper oxidase domain-containing protein [Flavobacteriales bacterium]